eukprot:SAG31_NODE_229_length_19770_cov_9.887194_6_plen_173_part_00
MTWGWLVMLCRCTLSISCIPVDSLPLANRLPFISGSGCCSTTMPVSGKCYMRVPPQLQLIKWPHPTHLTQPNRASLGNKRGSRGRQPGRQRLIFQAQARWSNRWSDRLGQVCRAICKRSHGHQVGTVRVIVISAAMVAPLATMAASVAASTQPVSLLSAVRGHSSRHQKNVR